MSQIRDGISEARETRQPYAAGQSTQMVVGATETTDATILTTLAPLLRVQSFAGFTIPASARFHLGRPLAGRSRAAGAGTTGCIRRTG